MLFVLDKYSVGQLIDCFSSAKNKFSWNYVLFALL